MNQQPPSHSDLDHPTSLLVHSVFNTIQGEGPHVGMPACFVRLAGCNLQCPMCDTEYTEGATRRDVQELAQSVQDTFKHSLVVITGGEPFRQDILPFVIALQDRGLHVQIETNGTLPPQGDFNRWIDLARMDRIGLDVVCSPKAGGVHPKIMQLLRESHAGAIKYVLDAGSVDINDGLPILALDHPAHPKVWRNPRHNVPVYIQPADTGDPERNTVNLQLATEVCQKFGYRLCVQMHKIIGVP